MPPPELSGAGWEASLHPDDRARVLTAWRAAAERPQGLDESFRLRRAGGAYHWMRLRAVPRCAADGAVYEYVCAAFDESELVAAREAHDDHLQLLEVAARGADMVLFLIDEQGRFVFSTGRVLNESAEVSTLVGMNACEIAGAGEAVRRALAGEDVAWEGEVHGRWFAVRLTPARGRDGQAAGVAGVAVDRSELHETALRLHEREEKLGRLVEGAVGALSGIVELKDPYTAGHQQRVAALCDAIARRLGWPAERRDWLRLAALLHDIGKVMCPAELLSKPARLSGPEMALVRAHAPASAAILSGIDFEGPVVTAVAQHHERLDGSGYPAGLKEVQIVAEARIIAVADVVEAMASHRPYRAALGIPLALDEVATGRGRRYDPEVSDACAAVFAAGFSFDEVPS